MVACRKKTTNAVTKYWEVRVNCKIWAPGMRYCCLCESPDTEEKKPKREVKAKQHPPGRVSDTVQRYPGDLIDHCKKWPKYKRFEYTRASIKFWEEVRNNIQVEIDKMDVWRRQYTSTKVAKPRVRWSSSVDEAEKRRNVLGLECSFEKYRASQEKHPFSLLLEEDESQEDYDSCPATPGETERTSCQCTDILLNPDTGNSLPFITKAVRSNLVEEILTDEVEQYDHSTWKFLDHCP